MIILMGNVYAEIISEKKEKCDSAIVMYFSKHEKQIILHKLKNNNIYFLTNYNF
jgi:hypothetical protein